MTPHDKRYLVNALQRALEEAVKMPTATACKDCIHNSIAFCKLWNDQIPSDVLPVGCEKWTFDENSPPF